MFEYLYNQLHKIKRALYKNLIEEIIKSDFTIHLPILILIAEIFKIRNYSTLTFMDKSILPNIISIKFFEETLDSSQKVSN